MALLFYAIFLNRCFFVVSKARCNSLGRSEDTVVKCQKDFKRNKQIGNRPRWFRQAGRRVGGQDGRIASAKYIAYMGFDQNSFIRERPFFANKKFTFAKLSRTPCLSFAGPMLANNTSYKDSFTTWQITPENHGSLLDNFFSHAASITESLLRAGCC